MVLSHTGEAYSSWGLTKDEYITKQNKLCI